MTRCLRVVGRGIMFVALIATPGVSKPPSPPPGEPIAYGIICSVALGALPSGLREMLQPQQAALCKAAAVGPVRPIDSDLVRAITASFDELVLAFRPRPTSKANRASQTEKLSDVIRAAATLVQLSTRAAMPPREGETAKSDAAPHLDSSWAGAIAAHHIRLQYEARVSPVRFHPVAQIGRTVHVVMLRGQQASRRLFDSDGAHQASDKSQSHSHRIEHATLLIEPSERSARVLEDRIEDGALLAARLIGAAWIRAGRPSAPSDSVKTTTETTSETTQGEYVASRYSKVFHKANCPHVKRIKPANRVTFSTLEQARAAHKKPCHTCKPG